LLLFSYILLLILDKLHSFAKENLLAIKQLKKILSRRKRILFQGKFFVQ
jgi:hypothetical protein